MKRAKQFDIVGKKENGNLPTSTLHENGDKNDRVVDTINDLGKSAGNPVQQNGTEPRKKVNARTTRSTRQTETSDVADVNKREDGDLPITIATMCAHQATSICTHGSGATGAGGVSAASLELALGYLGSESCINR